MPSRILENLGTAGGQVGGAVKSIFSKQAAAELAATVPVAGSRGIIRTIGGGIGSFIMGFVTVPFKIGAKVVALPFKAADRLVGNGIGGIGNFFAKNPKTAIGLTAVAAVAGIGHTMNKRAHRTAEAEMNQLGAMQAMAPQAAYGLQPGEFDQVAAPRMREAGQNGSQVEALAARQQSAQPDKPAALA